MSNQNDPADRKIGYKQPPLHSRFQPGKSGNPRGRPRGRRNLATDVRRTLAMPVRITGPDGKPRNISTQEAALLRLREKSLKGDPRAIERLLGLADRFNNPTGPGSGGDETMSAEDQAILDEFLHENRTHPDSKDQGREVDQ